MTKNNYNISKYIFSKLPESSMTVVMISIVSDEVFVTKGYRTSSRQGISVRVKFTLALKRVKE